MWLRGSESMLMKLWINIFAPTEFVFWAAMFVKLFSGSVFKCLKTLHSRSARGFRWEAPHELFLTLHVGFHVILQLKCRECVMHCDFMCSPAQLWSCFLRPGGFERSQLSHTERFQLRWDQEVVVGFSRFETQDQTWETGTLLHN